MADQTGDGTVCMTVWSDYVCPFCYLEEPVLERLKAAYGDRIRIEWRAFELRPEPVPTLDPDGEYLHRTWEQAVYPMAARRDMILRLPPVQPRSRKALEAAEYARDRGRYDAMHHALFRAFFEAGRDLGDRDVLVAIGATVGLEENGLRAALEAGTCTDRVQQDEKLAQQLGIRAVPTMLIHRCDRPLAAATAISGAQPYEVVQNVVEQFLHGDGLIDIQDPGLFRPS